MARRGIFTRLLLGGVLAASTLGALAGSASAATKPERVVKLEHVRSLGEVLFDVKGFALYTYGHDTRNHSTCTGGCLAAWPALVVARGERPTGVAGLGTIAAPGGKRQVTWRGRPLYTFASDTTRGAVTGDGVGNFHVARLTATPTTTTTSSHSYGY